MINDAIQKINSYNFQKPGEKEQEKRSVNSIMPEMLDLSEFFALSVTQHLPLSCIEPSQLHQSCEKWDVFVII